MKLSFRAGDPQAISRQAAVYFVSENKLTEGKLAQVNKSLNGSLARLQKSKEFTGALNKSIVIPTHGALKTEKIILIGTGKKLTCGDDAYALGHKLVKTMQVSKVTKVALDSDLNYELNRQFCLGVINSDYSYELKSTKSKADKLELTLCGRASRKDADLIKEVTALNGGVNLTRDLVSAPANYCTPKHMATAASAIARRHPKVKTKILNWTDIKRMKMGGVIGVGKGSAEEPRVCIVEYRGAPATRKPLVFVGKGVTFDAGGISLKPGAGMDMMKWDMGGAGAVLGAMEAIAAAKYKVNVIGIVGCVENLPDGKAYKPSDVLTMYSGKTVEILNTDAEGRLVLADCLHYACNNYDPKYLLDLATLTGACAMLLGDQAAGFFTQNEKLSDRLTKASCDSADKLWRLPLLDFHKEQVKSDIADLKNIGGRKAGASTAAAFLSSFVDKSIPWAHLDIAGMAWNDAAGKGRNKGANGFGVQLLAALAKADAR